MEDIDQSFHCINHGEPVSEGNNIVRLVLDLEGGLYTAHVFTLLRDGLSPSIFQAKVNLPLPQTPERNPCAAKLILICTQSAIVSYAESQPCA
jgi:hypothetical protein